MMYDSLLEEFFIQRISTALETAIKESPRYQEVIKQQYKEKAKLDKVKFSKKQAKVIDQVISAANTSGAEYGLAAYQQGFQDGLKLMSELKHYI